MRLQSYVAGSWQVGGGPPALLRDASTGAVVAEAASEGLDFAATLRYAREAGGPALRAMTFRERAAMLRALGKRLLDFKSDFYALSHATGATRGDSWIDIDGGIGTMLVFASKGARELPDGHVYLDGGLDQSSPSFSVRRNVPPSPATLRLAGKVSSNQGIELPVGLYISIHE